MTQRARVQPGEDVRVAQRGVLGLTAVVGLQSALFSAVAGDPLAAIALPAIVLVVLLVRGSLEPAAYAGAVVWVLLLPHAAEMALIVPVVMAIGCLAIAIGADRLLGWVREDFGGRPPPSDVARGWFEDDPRA